MIWFLMFCSTTSGTGWSCMQPLQLPNDRICNALGQDMVDMSNGFGKYRCRPAKTRQN
jgi:hypothetical protein